MSEAPKLATSHGVLVYKSMIYLEMLYEPHDIEKGQKLTPLGSYLLT